MSKINYPKFCIIVFIILALMGIVLFYLKSTFGQLGAGIIILAISLIVTFILKDENKKLRQIIGAIIWFFGLSINYDEGIKVTMLSILCSMAIIITGAYLCMKSSVADKEEK